VENGSRYDVATDFGVRQDGGDYAVAGNSEVRLSGPTEVVVDARQWVVQVLWTCWRRRNLLVRGVVAGLVVGTIVAFVMPKTYESTARVVPPDNSSASGVLSVLTTMGVPGGIQGIAPELLGVKSTGALIVGVLGSRTVQDRLIDSFDLKNVYGTRDIEAVRRKLGDRTSISENHKSGIITITVADRSPQRAAQLANAYVEQTNRLLAEINTSAAHRERVFIEGRLEVVKRELDDSAKSLSEFSSKNTTIDIEQQAKAMLQAVATVEGELIAAQSELRGLEQIYTDNNIRVRTAKERVDELRRQLENLTGKSAGPGGTPGDVETLFPSIRKLPLVGITFADLYRRAKISETVYETLTKQYELARVQEAKEVPTVRVMDVADIPQKKSSPKRLLIMISGGLLGFIVSTFWAVGYERWQDTDSDAPLKQFLREVSRDLKSSRAFVGASDTYNVWLSRIRRHLPKSDDMAPRAP